MQYKLLALDLDDTILDKEQRLTDKTVRTIKEIQTSGVKVIIATGRMLVSAMPFFKKLGLTGPMITYNGAYVKDITTNRLLYHYPIKLEIAREIISVAEAEGLHINLYQDDQLFIARKNQESEIYEKISGVQAWEVGSLVNFINKDVIKLLIVEEDRERYQHYLNYFKEKYMPSVAVTESKSNFIEFMAGGVSKGKALEAVARNLGFKQQEVVAIGDSWNDVEMIKWAGLGIAMENSPEGVKEEADRVAPDHDQGGVARILEEIFA